MHTKGPWRIGPRFDDTYVVIESDEAYVARTVGGNDLANARLIAAAPELLEALEQATEYFEADFMRPDWYVQAIEAINKAKGE